MSHRAFSLRHGRGVRRWGDKGAASRHILWGAVPGSRSCIRALLARARLAVKTTPALPETDVLQAENHRDSMLATIAPQRNSLSRIRCEPHDRYDPRLTRRAHPAARQSFLVRPRPTPPT